MSQLSAPADVLMFRTGIRPGFMRGNGKSHDAYESSGKSPHPLSNAAVAKR